MPAVGDQHRPGPPGAMASAITANPFEEPQRRMSEYTAQEIATLQSRLDKQLGPEYISSRPGAAGQKVHYLAAEKCINLANEVFGFNGWSSAIQNIQIDFVDENPQTGKISLGLSVIVRVTLKDGTFHEDIGYGHIENCKGKAAAFEKAKKEGTTDALKRALRTFGNVLGNCIYDKEYLAKVTKVRAAPAKWDVANLHRHPDYAPVKKEPVEEKRADDVVDLPPRPVHVSGAHTNSTLTLDGDGEFGSDLFDESDFVGTTEGNPDEIMLEPEQPKPQQQSRPNVTPAAQRQGNFSRPPARMPDIVTPSKPERLPDAVIPRQQHQMPSSLQNAAPRPNASVTNQQQMVQRRPTPGPAQQPQQYTRPGAQPPSKSSQEATTGTNVPGPMNNRAQGNNAHDAEPSGSPSMSGNQRPGDPPSVFYSARAVDMLRSNNAPPSSVPQFDPRSESPSIRKTAGVDHNKSVPITKPMLAQQGVTPTNNTRDFVNPSADLTRRIGAPGGGIASPARGPSTSSYRPLTRPAVDTRNAGGNMGASNGAPIPQNMNGKRPPLNDVTNAGPGAGPSVTASVSGPGDPKRPRIGNGDTGPAAQQAQQQAQQKQQ
ncbi:DNA repair protein rad52 [Paecilomyces lecythidis]|uniref:DNA repair protein rad52 n=1 Tax=Paecilomyces lecythidis TaxID=3004212 RepID=A0ABR3X914_9EURO